MEGDLSRQELTAETLVLWEKTRMSLRNCIKLVMRSHGVNDHKVWGTVHAYAFEIVKLLGTIDALIDHVTRGSSTREMHPWVRNPLRVATYEMKWRNLKPAIATSEAVRIISERVGDGPARFANAILYDVEEATLEDVLENAEDEIERLSVKYSHPTWYVKHLLDLLGKDELIELMKANNEEPVRYLRVNAHLKDPDAVILALEREGVVVEEDPHIPLILRVVEWDVPPVRTEPYKRGWVTYQDKASAAAAYALAPEPGEKVLDACSAPGSKAAYVYAHTCGEIELTCVDINPRRIKEMKRNFKKWGVEAEVVRADAAKLKEVLDRDFDAALVDPPCSSSGSYNRTPEAKWTVRWRHVRRYADGQLKILLGVSGLRPGRMVYSTCSVTVPENEDVIHRFLSRDDAYSTRRPDVPVGAPGFDRWMDRVYDHHRHVIRLWPHGHMTEGFCFTLLEGG